MLVELGTPRPIGAHEDPQGRPVITYMRIPDDVFSFDRNADVEHWRSHLSHSYVRNKGITNYEGGEMLCQLTHPDSGFGAVANGDPSWVWSDDPDAARVLSEYYQAPIAGDPAQPELGHGDFVDETHWRRYGTKVVPPGVPQAAAAAGDVTALLTNVGVTQIAQAIGGSVAPKMGQGSAATATTLTAAGLVASAWIGATLVVADTTNTTTVWGNVISNTTTAFTVDQWYNAAGGVATTPAAGFEYLVAFITPPAWWIGITTTSITPAIQDTSLSGEAMTNGMARKLGTYTVTSAASGTGAGPPSITFTVSTTFTYTGSGATTFFGMGLFPSAVKTDVTDTMYWETLFSGSFTVTNNGDQATVTDAFTAT